MMSPKIMRSVLMRYSHLFRWFYLAVAIAIVVGIFWVGAKPIAVGLFTEPIDKIAHSATFSLIAVLLWLSFLRGRPVIVIALVGVIGAADEIHQIYLPGRTASWEDFAADLLAAVVITSLLEYIRRRTE